MRIPSPFLAGLIVIAPLSLTPVAANAAQTSSIYDEIVGHRTVDENIILAQGLETASDQRDFLVFLREGVIPFCAAGVEPTCSRLLALTFREAIQWANDVEAADNKRRSDNQNVDEVRHARQMCDAKQAGQFSFYEGHPMFGPPYRISGIEYDDPCEALAASQ